MLSEVVDRSSHTVRGVKLRELVAVATCEVHRRVCRRHRRVVSSALCSANACTRQSIFLTACTVPRQQSTRRTHSSRAGRRAAHAFPDTVCTVH